jgi:predicted DNA-binding protein (MmcQ/YjbR family)
MRALCQVFIVVKRTPINQDIPDELVKELIDHSYELVFKT